GEPLARISRGGMLDIVSFPRESLGNAFESFLAAMRPQAIMTKSEIPFGILYEDNHLLVVNKPAGLATMGTAEGTETLVRHAGDYIRDKYAKPGNVYLGVVSRL